MLELTHQILRWTHIAIGTFGLLLFWVPIIARKGGELHVTAGRWYIRSVHVVTVSALISCAWGIFHPGSFTGRETLGDDFLIRIRFFLGILAILAILTLKNALLGNRILQIKRSGEPLQTMPLILAHWLQLAIAVGAILYAGKLLLDSSFAGQYFILLVLGVVCLLDFLGQLNFIANPESRKHPILTHIECMIGCGIAFHTAALITIVNNVLKIQLPGALSLLPWLIPTLIGIPATAIVCAKWAKKLNVDKETQE